MRVNRPLAFAGALTVLATSGLLSGCGVTGTDFNPGIAAVVGSETVSTRHVDEVSANYCTAVEDQIKDAGNRLPMRILKSGVAGQLAIRSAVEQLADEYGVEPTDQYRRELSTIETQATGLDEDVADSFIEVNSVGPYVADVLTSVGAATLDDADATIEEKQTAGLETLADWVEKEGVELHPQYGLEFRDGQPAPVDTDISYPVGDLAKAGLLPEPDQDYAAALPDDLVCG